VRSLESAHSRMNRRIKKDTKGLDIADLDDFTDSDEEEKNKGVKSPEKRKTFPRRFEVETILEQRERKGVKEFLVKWVGWAHEHNTWEPREHLEGTAEQVLVEFELRQQEAKMKKDYEQREQEAKMKRFRDDVQRHQQEAIRKSDDELKALEAKRKREEEQREQEAKRKRYDNVKERIDQAKKSKVKVGTDKNETNNPLSPPTAAARKGRLLRDTSDSDECIEIIKEEMVKGKPYAEKGKEEEVVTVPVNEQLVENEETEDNEEDVEINIKIKMKPKTFGKVIDKATKFLDAAAKFNLYK